MQTSGPAAKGLRLAFALLAGAPCHLAADEVRVSLPPHGDVLLSTRGPSAFRVRLVAQGVNSTSLESPMILPEEADAPFWAVDAHGARPRRAGDVRGVAAAFGSVALSEGGSLMLNDTTGNLITKSAPLNSSFGPAGLRVLGLSTNLGKLYGRGASPDDASELTASIKVDTGVWNRAVYTPYYYSTDGYSALGVVNSTRENEFPVKYSRTTRRFIEWEYTGAFELYLMPASTLSLGTQAYFQLTGHPRVPPRYAFGFTASRWGWANRSYIEDTLSKFRSMSYPIDAFICDFEWFTNISDYGLQPAGETWYNDFGFYNLTFPAPKKQLTSYRAKYNVRFGGIRKPRLGNRELLQMARSKGWILPNGELNGAYPPADSTYADHRNLNFSNPSLRTWYAEQMVHYLDDGVEFWWNDEGETDFFTFYWWNQAQLQSLRMRNATKRFFSLNRAWTPGMSRVGAAVWTGDINPTWDDLRLTPGFVLNWGLGGAPYVACDMGGFTGQTEATLLTRWFQVGAFMPLMRVHSTLESTPHWPWLWGRAAAGAMRKALELRYALLPYHYSLAHEMHQTGALWMRPMAMDFPDDPDAAALTSQWLDGRILVAPVLREDQQKQVYLPKGVWYRLGSAEATRGPAHLEGPAALDEVPAYAPAGAVLPMAPKLQHSGELPGGPVRVEVYTGSDGFFDLVEDDGETTGYEAGDVKRTSFQWKDDVRTLSWTSDGKHFAGAFEQLFVVAYGPGGAARSSTVPLGASGWVYVPPGGGMGDTSWLYA